MVAWSAWSWVWGCAFVCVNTFIQRMIIPANVGEGFLQVSTWVKLKSLLKAVKTLAKDEFFTKLQPLFRTRL